MTEVVPRPCENTLVLEAGSFRDLINSSGLGTDGNEAEPHLICVATSRNQNAWKRPAIYFSSLVP